MSRRRAEADAKIALPITPMLDMTFQLLFFFIMNFNPADLEGQIDAMLPAPEVVKGVGGEGGAPDEREVLFPSDLTVEVRTRQVEGAEGGISAIFVRGPDGNAESVNGLDGLERYLAGRRVNFDAIKIRGDGRLRIKHLLKVMDVCKAAGYTRTTLIPPEEVGR